MRALRIGLVGLCLLLASLLAGLWWHPPELVRVGANYSAKMVCSNVFLAGRDPRQVLHDDVQAPGHPLLRWMQVRVDRDQAVVHAGLFGVIGDGLAVWRPGTGCAVVPDGDLADARRHQLPAAARTLPPIDAASPWPDGAAPAPDAAPLAALRRPDLLGPGLRAALVIHQGRLIDQVYGPGFDAATPLLGWSMSKTVTAALIGQLIGEDRLSLDQAGFWPAGDGRARIRLADLMAMSSGLRFNEGYGDVSDVTRMLYLEPDMADFVHRQPTEHPPGQVFSYASGSTVLLSRLWQQAAGPGALEWPGRRLFGPLGMRSAVLETDARGNFVGSSYLYACAQDWARFAQFLLQDGQWQGQRLLPAGYVTSVLFGAAPAAPQRYTRGQMWLQGPEGPAPDSAFGLPGDTVWLEGHDGQSIAIVPSRGLVLLRMGLTPARQHFQPQHLLRAVLDELPH